MFGKKSRLERENDALEERIEGYIRKNKEKNEFIRDLDLKYHRILREYRYSQKANCRRKRANRKLRSMLDDVGWPQNDPNPSEIYSKMVKGNHGRPEVLDEDGKPKKLVPRRLP